MSALLTPDLEYAPSLNATKFRDLEGPEEFLWLVEQNVTMFHAVIAEVHGPTTIVQWVDALDAMQIRYPLLSASIRKIPGKRPFFEKMPGASVPLRIAPLVSSLVLEEEMEKELQKSFGDGSGPLTRATLFYSADRSVIMFATHHSSMDGKSHLLLLQDLLAAVAGEDSGEALEVQPGLGQLVGLPAPAEYQKKLEGRSVAPENRAILEVPRVQLQRLQLCPAETEVLLWRAKEEGTTVHAALVVALAMAGKRYPEKWNSGQVHCMSPIDMRGILKMPGAAGLLISAHIGPVPTADETSFWSVARAVRENMLPAQSADGARHLLGAYSSMVADEHNARDFYLSVVSGPPTHELMVTNYAGFKVRTEYGNLKIEQLFTGSPSARPASQKVSVLTVNGRLGMTVVARDLFPTLLEDARDILIRA